MADRPSPPRPPRIPLFALAALVLAALGGAAWYLYHRGPDTSLGGCGAERANVLLVSIDTLRADRTGGPLTPALNALASRGARFVNARSPVPLTLPAHASLMTGLLPPHHGVRMNGVHRLSPDVPTLATALHQAGYQTGAVIGAYVLDRRFGLAQGFDSYDAEIPRREEIAGELEAERRGEIVADRAIAWLNSSREGAPFFLWVHLYDPHAPYEPPQPWLGRAGGQPYDGEVAYADAQLGRVLDAIGARGLADRTLVVVAGDHGESLGDHGEPTHGLLVYDPAVRIPLVIAGPGVPRALRSDAASLVDIVPTLTRFSGSRRPAAWTDGTSWHRRRKPSRRKPTSRPNTPKLPGSPASGRWSPGGGSSSAAPSRRSSTTSPRIRGNGRTCRRDTGAWWTRWLDA